MAQTSIVLVHAHTLFREGLRQNILSANEYRIAGEASDGHQTIQLVGYMALL